MCVFKCSDLTNASNWLQQGNILVYPTESVWGIGCDAMNEQAVKKILAIKNRSIDKGMIVITDCIERLEPFLAELDNQKQHIIRTSWQTKNSQQATTWLLPIPKQITIPTWITGQHQSLAIRVINHPQIKQLCEQVVSEHNQYGFIISTSCNPATLPPATTLQQAQAYFANDNSIGYLQGDTLGYRLPSQIKDAISLRLVR